MPEYNETELATRGLLIDATIRVIASHGLRGAEARTICDDAGLSVDDLMDRYPSVDALVDETARVICDQPVFPGADPTVGGATVPATLAFLAVEHRAYVQRFPERFATIVQLTAPALLGRPHLVELLAGRNRRSRAEVATHLWVHRVQGVIDPGLDVESIAWSLVDSFVGIETCFLMQPDAGLRDRAYAEAVTVFAALLAPK